MKEKHFPNLLVQTNWSVSLAHGTGAVLLRQLKDYPKTKVANVFANFYSEAVLDKSLWLQMQDDLRAKLLYFAYPIKQVIKGEKVTEGCFYKEARKGLMRINFSPQVLYANVVKHCDLMIIAELRKHIEMPTLLYFQDYFGKGESEQFFADLKSILQDKQTREFWALTPEIADDIETRIGIRAKVVNNQHIEITEKKKQNFSQFDKDFQIVIMGTIYSVSMLNKIKELWRALREALPELSAIKWYAHPKSIDKIKIMNASLGQEIEYAGFFQGEALNKKLLEADMTLIPVNSEASAQDNIAKYSLPSRISELAALGIPMFVLASPDTATAGYVRRTQIALCETPSNLEACKAKLIAFIQTSKMREEFSQRARHYAEQNLDIKVYREELYNKFIELWQSSR